MRLALSARVVRWIIQIYLSCNRVDCCRMVVTLNNVTTIAASVRAYPHTPFLLAVFSL